MFGNRVLRGMFGLKRNEVTGEWRKLHIEEGPCCYQAMSNLIKLSKYFMYNLKMAIIKRRNM